MSANLSTTLNGTQLSGCSNPVTEAKRIGYTFAYCFMFVVSLVGNIFLGTIVYKTKSMRKPINFLIVNMAMSDMLFPVFQFSRIITLIQVGSWLISGSLGQALCKLVSFLPEVSAAVSIQSLVLIAVDRFGAVVFPLRSPLISSKLCPFFILATWINAMAIQSPFVIASEIVEYPARLRCVPRWGKLFGEFFSFESYLVANIVTLYYIPLVLIAILYIIIVFKLKSYNVPGSVQSVNAEQQRVKRERNVLKMSIAIVFMFAVCYLPMTIYYLLLHFSGDLNLIQSCGFLHFASIAFWLSRSNCAINPFICFIFSGNYRDGLKNLLSCCFAECRANQVEPPSVELRYYSTRL